MKRSIFDSARGSGVAVFSVMLLLSGTLLSQQSLDSNFRMTGPGLLAVFEPQREAMQACSAVFYDGRKEIIYGVVVSHDGYVLTKNSEISGVRNLDVRIDRQLFKKANVVMTNALWDLALVKVDAEGLTVPDYAASSDLPQGTFVVVNGATTRTKRRILAGIISAIPREIPADGGAVLGVQLDTDDGKLVVKEVSEGSGAEEAQMLKGDAILEVDGKEVAGIEELTGVLKDRKAGSRVKITIRREDELLELDVRLSPRGELFAQMNRNDQMSGDFSKRRSGFPRVIQHDVLGNSSTMGGPVLNLEGKLIGMNIARANRAETFAIPVEELRELSAGMIEQARK